MPHLRKSFSLVMLLIVFLLIGTSTNSQADTLSAEIIKLYSDGKVAGQWESIRKGKMDGPCYVFEVRKGAYTPEVRVCGLFSVEEKR